MKKVILSAAIISMFAGANLSQAEENSDGGLYLGLKTGNMDSDVNAVDIESPVGFVLGYEFGGGGAIELERNSADVDVDYGFISFSEDYDTTAVYGVYRSEGKGYIKLKAGFLREEIGSASDSGLSVGVGAGVRGEHVSLEAEFTVIEEDVNYFSIGANVHF